jgi:hypothetical protein
MQLDVPPDVQDCAGVASELELSHAKCNVSSDSTTVCTNHSMLIQFAASIQV